MFNVRYLKMECVNSPSEPIVQISFELARIQNDKLIKLITMANVLSLLDVV